MLKKVLREIQIAEGPITIKELSRNLGIDPHALDGMLEFWVRKGRITTNEKSYSNDSTGCNKSCSGTPDCVYVAKMPKTFSIPSKNGK